METRTDQYYSPQDAATACSCSPATIKRVADQLRLPVARTVGGNRFFTKDQVEHIQQELTRREIEAARN